MTTLPRERVRRHRWERRGVDLQTVVEHLRQQHIKLTQEETGDQDHPHPRNTVMNLIVSASDEERMKAADRVVETVAAGHPLRAIVILRTADRDGEIDAEVTTEAHQLLKGAAVQREQVVLRVRGDVATHIASLVEPLLVSDVPTYLWWTGNPPLGEAGLRDALDVCDVLIVDSAHFDRPEEALLELAALAERLAGRLGLVDLQWWRQRAWREMLAQFFAPVERREWLGRLQRLTIDCVGRGKQSLVASALLVGWLAAALGWRLTGSSRATEEMAEALYASREEVVVHVTVRSIEAPALQDATLRAVRFEGRSDDSRFAMLTEVNRQRPDHAHVRVEMSAAAPVEQRVPLPHYREAELLIQALSDARRDPVYVRSLKAAANLVHDLR